MVLTKITDIISPQRLHDVQHVDSGQMISKLHEISLLFIQLKFLSHFETSPRNKFHSPMDPDLSHDRHNFPSLGLSSNARGQSIPIDSRHSPSSSNRRILETARPPIFHSVTAHPVNPRQPTTEKPKSLLSHLAPRSVKANPEVLVGAGRVLVREFFGQRRLPESSLWNQGTTSDVPYAHRASSTPLNISPGKITDPHLKAHCPSHPLHKIGAHSEGVCSSSEAKPSKMWPGRLRLGERHF
jgi:hypothetical protein